jgi:hypothetical protein
LLCASSLGLIDYIRCGSAHPTPTTQARTDRGATIADVLAC